MYTKVPDYVSVQYNDIRKGDIVRFDNGREATVLRTMTMCNKVTLELQYTDVYGGSGKTTTYAAALILVRI